MAEIVVVGSINMDIVTRTERFPTPGETLYASSTGFYPGGKGANQAVAASRLGANVAMIGAVGGDAFGVDIVRGLSRDGIDTRGVITVSEAATGVAIITVNAQGENSILLSPGANVQFSAAAVNANALPWDQCRVVLLQNEIAPVTNRNVILKAAERGIRVFYNPAPAFPMDDEVLMCIDTLVLNEHEAGVISGISVEDERSAESAVNALIERGARSVVLTLGSQGVLYRGGIGAPIRLPAFQVAATDTTAAGDTFIGALAVSVMEGKPMEDALRFAQAAAALSVTKQGAQSSIPSRRLVKSFLVSRA